MVHEVPRTTRPWRAVEAAATPAPRCDRNGLSCRRGPGGGGCNGGCRPDGNGTGNGRNRADMAGARGLRARLLARFFHGICQTRFTRIPRLHYVVGLEALFVEGKLITSSQAIFMLSASALRGSPHSCSRRSSFGFRARGAAARDDLLDAGAAARHADRGLVAAGVHAGRGLRRGPAPGLDAAPGRP